MLIHLVIHVADTLSVVRETVVDRGVQHSGTTTGAAPSMRSTPYHASRMVRGVVTNHYVMMNAPKGPRTIGRDRR